MSDVVVILLSSTVVLAPKAQFFSCATIAFSERYVRHTDWQRENKNSIYTSEASAVVFHLFNIIRKVSAQISARLRCLLSSWKWKSEYYVKITPIKLLITSYTFYDIFSFSSMLYSLTSTVKTAFLNNLRTKTCDMYSTEEYVNNLGNSIYVV